jgi:hypothetical protein
MSSRARERVVLVFQVSSRLRHDTNTMQEARTDWVGDGRSRGDTLWTGSNLGFRIEIRIL